MADEKKKVNPLFDLGAPFKGLNNIVTGKVFDPKSWLDEPDAAPTTSTTGANSNGNGDEEVEETTTRTVRRGRRRDGTFKPAAAKPAPERKPDDGKPDDGSEPPTSGSAGA